MRRLLKAVLTVTLLSSAAITASPGPAQAVVPPFGLCRYAGTNPGIDIKSRLTPTYRTALGAAVNRWNATSAAGALRFADTGANIDAWTRTSSEDWWATTHGPCTAQKYWSATVQVEFNNRLMARMSARQKWIVAAHELGHTYGLGHVSMTCAGRPSVMEQGAEKFGCTGTPPWSDDVTGVNSIY